MIWTIVLVTLGVVGTWLAVKHWQGWLICALSEILWFIYALTLHSLPLAIMSVFWFGVHGTNFVRTYLDAYHRRMSAVLDAEMSRVYGDMTEKFQSAFYGVPVHVDPLVPPNTAYLIDTEHLKAWDPDSTGPMKGSRPHLIISDEHKAHIKAYEEWYEHGGEA